MTQRELRIVSYRGWIIVDFRYLLFLREDCGLTLVSLEGWQGVSRVLVVTGRLEQWRCNAIIDVSSTLGEAR